MSNEAKNFSKFVHFTDALYAFADDVINHSILKPYLSDYKCVVEIGDDRFTLPVHELMDQIRKYRQTVLDDILCLSDDAKNGGINCDEGESGEVLSNEPKPCDDITMSDFDYIRRDMPRGVKEMFDLLLPISIAEEAAGHKSLDNPKPKSERIEAIEKYTMLRMTQIVLEP